MKRTIWIWLKGVGAALVSGSANGVITGFAAQGIAPETFNMGAGLSSMLKVAAAASLCSALLGVAFYLRQSPLPPPGDSQDLPPIPAPRPLLPADDDAKKDG